MAAKPLKQATTPQRKQVAVVQHPRRVDRLAVPRGYILKYPHMGFKWYDENTAQEEGLGSWVIVEHDPKFDNTPAGPGNRVRRGVMFLCMKPKEVIQLEDRDPIDQMWAARKRSMQSGSGAKAELGRVARREGVHIPVEGVFEDGGPVSIQEVGQDAERELKEAGLPGLDDLLPGQD